jgi:hypothetical protein
MEEEALSSMRMEEEALSSMRTLDTPPPHLCDVRVPFTYYYYIR